MSKNNNRWLRFLIILLPLLSLSGLCCLPPAAKAQTTGSITGKVLAGDPAAALAGVTVVAYPHDDDNPNNYLKVAKTNADGVYALTGLPLRSCKVRYYLTGGLNYLGGWHKTGSIPVANFSEASVITLTSSSSTQDLGEVSLVLGAKIKGTITKASDSTTGIAGVYVQAYSNGEWAKTSDAATDANGIYTISGLREGSYTVKFWAYQTEYTSEWYSADSTPTNTVPNEANASSISIAAGAVQEGVNAKLSTGGSISGTVFKTGTSGNTPVVGGQVRAYDSAAPHPFRGSATTGDTGTYTIKGLPPSGTYYIQFYEKVVSNAGAGLTEWYDGADGNGAASLTGATAVAIADNENKLTQNINAVLDRGAISGKIVYNTAFPTFGLTVKIYADGSEQPETASASAITNAAGNYTTSPTLPAGKYKVLFKENLWYNNKASFAEADAVDAGAVNVSATQVEPPPPSKLIPAYKLLILKPRP